MIYKVGVLGISGRIGLEVAGLLANSFSIQNDHLELADGISLSKKLASVEGISVRSLVEPPREPVHVWVDFSSPNATLSLLKQIDTPVVIGTTGFSLSEFEEIRKYSAQHPVLLSPNMAPGMNQILKLFSESSFAKDLQTLGFDFEINETHHIHKKDAPSGTARRWIDTLKAAGVEDISCHSSRLGEVLGVHQLNLVSSDEEISISHRVTNRSVFARGALMAAYFLLKQNSPGMYSFEKVKAFS